MKLEIGSAVNFISHNTQGAAVSRPGLVVGFGNRTSNDGAELPPVHIAFLATTRLAVLNDASWKEVFERAMDVPHASPKEDGRFYVIPEDAGEVRKELLQRTVDAEKALAELKAESEAKPEPPAPTPGAPAGKIRMVKGSKAAQ